MMEKPKVLYLTGDTTGVHERMRIAYLEPFRALLDKDFDVEEQSGAVDLAKACDQVQPDLIVFNGGIENESNRPLPGHTSLETDAGIPRIGLLLNDLYGISRVRSWEYLQDCGCDAFFAVYNYADNGIPELSEKCYYIPFWLREDLFQDYGLQKVVPVGLYGAGFIDFRRHYPWRMAIAKKLLGTFPCFTSNRPDAYSKSSFIGRDYAQLLNRTQLAFACGAITRAFTRKHLEICGARSALFCEETPILRSLGFRDGVNCIFVDADNVVDQVEAYLTDDAARETLTEAGYRFVRDRHSIKQRNQIIEWYRLRSRQSPDESRIVQTSPVDPLILRPGGKNPAPGWDERNPLEKIVDEAYRQLLAGSVDQAIQHFQRVTGGLPGHVESRTGEVICLMILGRKKEALQCLRQLRGWLTRQFGTSRSEPVLESLHALLLFADGHHRAEIATVWQPGLKAHPVVDLVRKKMNVVQLPPGENGSSASDYFGVQHRLMVGEGQAETLVRKMVKGIGGQALWEKLDATSLSVGELIEEARQVPVAPGYLVQLSDRAKEEGDSGLAFETLQWAVSQDRNCQQAYLRMGKLLVEAEKYEEAYFCFKEAERTGRLPEGVSGMIRSLESRPELNTEMVRTYRERASTGGFGVADAPRRILVFTNLLPPQEMGGFGRTVWEFCDGLIQRGHTLKILTADVPELNREPYPGYERVERHVERSLKLFGGWKNGVAERLEDQAQIQEIAVHDVKTILEAVQAFKPDICMAGNLDFLSGAMLDPILETGIPILHRLGNGSPGYEAGGTPGSPNYCIAGCSHWVNEELQRNGYCAGRFEVLPAGAPLENYYRLFPPSFNRLRICYAGLMMGYKGPHLLVEALGILKRLGVPFSCEMAGDLKDLAFARHLRQLIEVHHLKGDVRFLGFQSREGLAAMFARNNLFVFPSVFEEPFGKVQIEAQAAGLAVVRSATGGFADMLRDEVNGLLFKRNDAEDLARQLYVLNGDPDLWAALASQGQVDAFRFTTQACVERLEAILESMLA